MYRFAFVLLASVVITACGGSGNNNLSADVPIVAADLKIDNSNGRTATALSYQSADMIVGLGSLVVDNSQIADTPADVAKAAREHVSKAIDSTIHSLPIGPDMSPCLVDGTVTVSGDIASPFALSAGDTIVIELDQCDDGLDQVVDGRLDLTVMTFTGDLFANLYELQMSMAMSDFKVTTPADTLTSNGSTNMTLDTTLSPQVWASMRGDSMTIDSNASSETLTSFGSEQTVDAGISPAPYTWSSFGTLDSTQLAGVIRYTTPVTFEGTDADFPHTGELLVEGDSSSARLIAEDNVRVRIEFDYDGDGNIDDVLETTWVDLSG